MKTDERIVLEALAAYWNDPKFLSDEYPEPQYDDSQVALVRAGREYVLKQVQEREGGCCSCDEVNEITDSPCPYCWASVQLEGSEDEG